jgi:glycosyltransferase involved in cell wall biosynthesis
LDIKDKIIVYFIGSGKSDEIIRIKKIIKIFNLENIFVFTGYLNFNSQSILRSLDLTISLTRTFEGFNYSIAESISVGTPVLCTDVGGIKEYLNNNYVEVVQPGNIDEISSSIINFCTESEKWKKRAVLAKEYIIEKYNSDQMVLNYLDHFNYHLGVIKYKE